MSDPSQHPLSEHDRVQVLLHEYDTLRNEILARSGHIYQVVGIAAALVVFLLARERFDRGFYLGIFLLAVMAILFSYLISRDIRAAATRIQVLERDINRRAGETLLCWENEKGGAATRRWGWAMLKKPSKVLSEQTGECSRQTSESPGETRECPRQTSESQGQTVQS